MKNKFNKKRLLGIGLKVITVAGVLVIGNNTVFATDDPLAVINNLKDFMYQIIGAIGAILLLWGIVQIGMAIKSHDPSQRASGFMTLAGGPLLFRFFMCVEPNRIQRDVVLFCRFLD